MTEEKIEEVEMADGTKVKVSNMVRPATILSDSEFEKLKDKYRNTTVEELRRKEFEEKVEGGSE